MILRQLLYLNISQPRKGFSIQGASLKRTDCRFLNSGLSILSVYLENGAYLSMYSQRNSKLTCNMCLYLRSSFESRFSVLILFNSIHVHVNINITFNPGNFHFSFLEFHCSLSLWLSAFFRAIFPKDVIYKA